MFFSLYFPKESHPLLEWFARLKPVLRLQFLVPCILWCKSEAPFRFPALETLHCSGLAVSRYISQVHSCGLLELPREAAQPLPSFPLDMSCSFPQIPLYTPNLGALCLSHSLFHTCLFLCSALRCGLPWDLHVLPGYSHLYSCVSDSRLISLDQTSWIPIS